MMPERVASALESFFHVAGRGVLRVVKDRMLDPGHVAALPTAGDDFRGVLTSTRGGAGVKDTLYWERKGSADTHAFVEVVNAADAQTLASKTLTTPTIVDFTNAQHDHLDADDGGLLTLEALSDAGGLTAILTGSTTWNPPSMANQNDQAQDVTVTGAAIGDRCIASLTSATAAAGGTRPGAWAIACNVSAANTCTINLTNETASTIDLASGTLAATVFKHT